MILVMAVVILVGLLGNILLMYTISAKQAQELGRMRVQNIAANFQGSLTRAENALERVGEDLEQILQQGASEKEIRDFLLRQRELEYDLSDGLILNLFCVVDGQVLISGMETPEDYVLQDRSWYRGLQTVKKGDVYISSTYDDAFTDNMCFTVAKKLGDGVTIMGMDYSVSEIQSYVSALVGDGYGEAIIVDANEVIVGYSDSDKIGKKLSAELPQYRNIFLRLLAADGDSISLTMKQEGTDSTVFCSKTENGWYLISNVSNQMLYQDSYQQVVRGLLLLVLLVFVMIVFYAAYLWKTSRKKRLSETEETTEEMKEQKRLGKEKKTESKKDERRHAGDGVEQNDLTIQEQRKFQVGITSIFVVSMIVTIVICARMAVNDSRIKMEEELRKYNYEVGDWVLEQKSILDMFQNVVAAKPEILEDYEEMVKFLDDITRHYPKISATYIANPNFAHGHPMVMNNGWVPEADYVEEERVWYVGALTAEDFNITEPYYDARTGEYCITFSKMVQSEQGEFYGVFAIDFYLDVLTDILGEGYSDTGYAFLVDKNGLIIDHPNSEYEFSDEDSVNIHDLVYDKLYSENGIVTLKDYDGTLRVGDSLEETASGFRIIVLKNWWSIYGNVLEYILLFLGLFGICILGMNIVMHKMIYWQQQTNDNLKEMADSAIRAERAKSLFLSNMSHEIRTPINAVLGMNEMILRECDDEQLLGYAENIQNAGKTLLFLINDILDLSKIESGKMEIVPVEYEAGDLFLNLWNVIYLKANEKGLGISFRIPPDMPGKLFGDDIRIKQIVTNLLTNAVKYTEQGNVELIAAYERTEEKKLLLTISVKDTGMGIKEEDLGKLFEKFQRLDEEKNRNIEGTGLGMNITVSLVKLMDGDMKVDSVYQQGSTFTVTIPQKIVEETPVGDFQEILNRHTEKHTVEQQVFEAPEAKILVVDDNAMNLTVFQALLKRTKVHIDTAASGKECLSLAEKEKYHMIFMDHMMPEMDGIQTLHKLREMPGGPNEGVPVIALTANAIVGAKEMYLNEGFVDFLTKPVDGLLLENMVMKYLPEELILTGDQAGGEISPEEPEDEEERQREQLYLEQGISIRKGLGYAAGSLDVYLDLMKMFVRQKETMEQEIGNFLKEGDMENYGIQTHALKGNARMLGADQLADIAFEHEKAGKAGDLTYAKEHWEELTTEWETYRQRFDALYHEYRPEEEEKYAAVSDGEEIEIAQEEIDQVVKWLDEFQTDQAVEQLKAWLASPLAPQMHEKIKNALLAIEEEFDEDKAMEILKA